LGTAFPPANTLATGAALVALILTLGPDDLARTGITPPAGV